MADQVEIGDNVTWSWGGSHPGGTVAEVKAGEVSVTSHRGNEIKKTGDVSNPAVHIERSGNDVVKRASELQIEEKESGGAEAASSANKDSNDKQREDEKMEEAPQKEQKEGKENIEKKEAQEKQDLEMNKEKDGEEAKMGEKRKADEKADADEKEEGDEEQEVEDDHDSKKLKTSNGAFNGTSNGDSSTGKRGPGRPKSNGEKKLAAKKEKKVPAVGKTERKTRSQGTA